MTAIRALHLKRPVPTAPCQSLPTSKNINYVLGLVTLSIVSYIYSNSKKIIQLVQCVIK